VIVGNDIGTFLGSRWQCECGYRQPEEAEKSAKVHGSSLSPDSALHPVGPLWKWWIYHDGSKYYRR